MITCKKLGTIDRDIVESNPIVFKGKVYLMEYIRYHDPAGGAPSKSYHGNLLGNSYCRLRDLEDMSCSEPFGIGFCFGCAWSDGDHIAVTVTDTWGGEGFYILESDDMIHWSDPRALYVNKDLCCYNSSMCKAHGRYINLLEVGPRLKKVDCVAQNYNIFAASDDLVNWEIIPGHAPLQGWTLRFYDQWYFLMGLQGNYQTGFTTHIFRSRDLKNWESSPQNPIFSYDGNDRIIHPLAQLDEAQKEEIASAVNINVSDVDMCDHNGKLLFSYSWGDQGGHEYLALAEAECSEKEFCFACFEEE